LEYFFENIFVVFFLLRDRKKYTSKLKLNKNSKMRKLEINIFNLFLAFLWNLKIKKIFVLNKIY